MKFSLGVKKAAAALCAAAVLFAGGAVGSYVASKYTITTNGVEKSDSHVGVAVATEPTAFEKNNPLVGIVKRSMNAVVNIDVETMVTQQPMADFNPFKNDPFFREFFGEDFFPQQTQPRKVPQRGKGSGFIVSKEGYILTNNHVVENADKIKVTMLDGRTFDAKKIGQDPTFDIAVIQIKAKDLPVLALGDSNKSEVGEMVVAIGNPHGFENTVTAGIVSGKNRTLPTNEVSFQGFLQTDAAINPGNSGGPLIDMNGNVIGINTAIVPYAQGIGFAIPVNVAKQVLDDLIKHGEVKRGWIGAAVQHVTEPLAKAYNIPVKEGAIIASIQKNSPAEKSGLMRGDVIVRIGDKEIKDSQDVVFAVRNHLAGETVKFTVYRDGKKIDIDVKLGATDSAKTPALSGKRSDSKNDAPKESTKMGITVVENSEEFAKKHKLNESGGVVVTQIERGSLGQKLGLRPGDVILEINKKPMNTVSDWEQAISKKGAMALLISRDGSTIYIVNE